MKHALFALLFGLFAAATPFTAGNREPSDHDGHEASLPDIEAVNLPAGQKLRVVATTSIIGDIAANIGRDAIELTVIIPVGQDPHSYEPTPKALTAIEKAHVVFMNGFGLEEGLEKSIESTAKGAVVRVSAGIEPIEGGDHEDDDHDGNHEEKGDHDHGPVDPHVWFDPTNVMVWVENIEHVLSAADPKNGARYGEHAESYLALLTELDGSIRRRLDSIPVSRRKLVTDHGLFGYFADEYGFEVFGSIIPSVSTSADVSARQIADLVEVLRAEEITAVFLGSTAGRSLEKLAGSITEELGDQVEIFVTLTGSLSEPGTRGDTYIGYMEYNVDQILSGLTSR